MRTAGLSERQQLLLRRVVESHVELGRPIGSKQLTDQADVAWSPSTVRYELATLEELGYLNHPHTSAGRVPTDAGYRFYADVLLQEGGRSGKPGLQLELSTARREVDAAMRVTTETLSQVTNLVAAVSAPPLDTATVRHVDVLLLQPQVVLVVVITSTGAVNKRAFTFEGTVDAGLVDWAASYLKERLVGSGPRRADTAQPPRSRPARRPRACLHRHDRAGLLRPRRVVGGIRLRRGRRPPADRPAASTTSMASTT